MGASAHVSSRCTSGSLPRNTPFHGNAHRQDAGATHGQDGHATKAAASAIRAAHDLTSDNGHAKLYYGGLVGGVRIALPAEYLRGRE